MSTVKSKKLQVGTDATSSNNFTIYQPSTPDGTLRIGVGNADSPTEVGRFTSAGYKPATAPAFRARKTSDQSVTTATITKMTFDTEDFDTTSDFADSKFTPSVEGYYQVNVVLRAEGSSQTQQILWLYKNGVGYSLLAFDREANTIHLAGSDLIYLNGTTDYIEVYARVDATAPAFGGDTVTNTCSFSAYLARAV